MALHAIQAAMVGYPARQFHRSGASGERVHPWNHLNDHRDRPQDAYNKVSAFYARDLVA
jgi:hypothetical protein